MPGHDVNIVMYDPPEAGDITNDDRAEMVRPLVQAFHDAYYWHPAGEPLATVIADIIGDLLHLVDRLDADQFEGSPPDANAVWEQGRNHYDYEIEEAALMEEEKST